MKKETIQINFDKKQDQSEEMDIQIPKNQKSFKSLEGWVGCEHNNLYFNDDSQRQKIYEKCFKGLFGVGEHKSCIEIVDSIQQNQKEKQKEYINNLSENQPIQDISEKKEGLYQKFKQIKNKNLQKYQNIANILQFLFEVKVKIKLMRFDPYSTKIFAALKNSCPDDLSTFLHTLKRIYLKIFEQLNNEGHQSKVFRKPTNETFSTTSSLASRQQRQNQFQLKNREFLLLMRFLTSQQKILQFIQNQQIQEYYIFLIKNICLGHYNNQANKKAPQKYQIQLIKELLFEKNGKEKFQRICSINHGNKLRRYNKQAYELLYKMSLNILNEIHQKVKKKTNLEQITKFINENEKWIHFGNNSIKNISEAQNQKEDSSQQFLNTYQKTSKKVSVRHVGSLQLPEKQANLNFNMKKVSSIQIEDMQQKDDDHQYLKQQKQANQ